MKLNESQFRQLIRQEIKKELREDARGDKGVYDTIKARNMIYNDLIPLLNDIIEKANRVDPDKGDWAEGIREDANDLGEELFDLGNELSMM